MGTYALHEIFFLDGKVYFILFHIYSKKAYTISQFCFKNSSKHRERGIRHWYKDRVYLFPLLSCADFVLAYEENTEELGIEKQKLDAGEDLSRSLRNKSQTRQRHQQWREKFMSAIKKTGVEVEEVRSRLKSKSLKIEGNYQNRKNIIIIIL